MKPIDKFILHVVHNLIPLNEYSEAEVKRLITRFKDEAEDFNIKISEDELRSYIEQFDRLKQSLKDKEIRNYSLSKLIKLATASKGAKSTEQQELTPDVVYHNEDNSIIIYNGSVEDNCIRFGKGERWCITRGSYTNYRYDKDRGYPTFYLARNSNLHDSDSLSFVAIQVRDPSLVGNRGKYVWTNRLNSPNESKPMDFSSLLSEIPWLQDIPNIQNILKYIPLTTKEKITQQYSREPISIKVWEKFPYEVKEQYLTVRSSQPNVFSDISNETFIQKYLPKYPQIAYYVAITPNLINPVDLLSNLEYFSNQDRKSITANLQQLIDVKYLKLEKLPFDVKKLLIKLDKFDIKSNEKLFISEDGSTIVNIHFTSPIKFDIYQEDDYYVDLSLNKRTINYIKNLNANDISQLPFDIIMDLSKEGVLTKDVIANIIKNAKTNENSPIIIKEKEGEEILLDSNTLSSYKISGQDISQIPFENENVQQIFNEEINDNKNFQNNILNIFKNIFGEKINTNILKKINDKKVLFNSIKSIPYSERTTQYKSQSRRDNINGIILTNTDSTKVFIMPSLVENFDLTGNIPCLDEKLILDSFSIIKDDSFLRSYFKYMKNTSLSFNDEKLLEIFRSWSSESVKKQFALASPPLNPNNSLVPYILDDKAFLINIVNPGSSFKVSSRTGNLLLFRAPNSMVQQASALLRGQPQIAIARRRGRPARVPGAAPAAQAAPTPQGNVNIANAMEEAGLLAGYESLPTIVKDRITTGNSVPLLANRGAARRTNLLAGRGRVIRAIDSGASSVYIIRLNNNTIIAAAAIYPGNLHYVITSDAHFRLNTPNDLVNMLTQRNLLESLKGIIASIYLLENPHRAVETKIILEHYLNLKHPNQSAMKTSELKHMISSVIAEVLAEKSNVGDPNIGEMSRKDMIEFLNMTEDEAKKYTNEELRELVVDKNSDLSEANKSTNLAKKIAQRYNTLKENK